MNRKYLFGVGGLIIGFIAMFFVTTTINKNAVAPVTASNRPGMARPGGATGQPNQQQMMGDIRETLEKAKNNPKDFEAQVAAAEAYLQIQQVEKAVEFVRQGIEADPKEAAHLGLHNFMAQYYSRRKNYPEAEKWYRRLIEVAPDDGDALVHLGQNFLERTPPEPDKAVIYIQSALKLNPKDGHALGHLVSAFALKKDTRGAEEAFKRMKEAEPDNQMIPDYEKVIADLKAGKPVTIPAE